MLFYLETWIEFLNAAVAHQWWCLTLRLLVLSADNLGKQFGPRSGPTKRRVWSGFKLFDTLKILLKEFFQKVDWKKSADDKKACKITH